MSSTEIARHQGNAAALTDDRFLDRIPQLARQLASSGMCPEPFRGKPDDIAIVGYSLADNGLRLSINTLPQCYVIKGKPGYMAQIQTAMAAMHGVTVRPIGAKCDDTSATVEVLLPDKTRHEVTFTMAEAEKARLTDGDSSMYKKFPASMLVARATTRAVSWYCPGVKLGLAGTVNMDDLAALDEDQPAPSDADGETGELVSPSDAKEELIGAYVARGSTREAAIPCARLLWESHGLGKGDPVPRSRLDLMLAIFDAVPAGMAAGETRVPAPDQAPDGDESVGAATQTPQEREHVTPEVVGQDQDAVEYGPDEEPFE